MRRPAAPPIDPIDPTGRTRETDPLAGWPSCSSGAEQATMADDVVVLALN